jgi:hypothetical protein
MRGRVEVPLRQLEKRDDGGAAVRLIPHRQWTKGLRKPADSSPPLADRNDGAEKKPKRRGM